MIPSLLSVPAGVDLWTIPLEPGAATVQACAAFLREDESARAARFQFERHQRRFIVARGALRRILSQYTGESPGRVQFEYQPQGKPFVAGLEFNLSHSGELALVAVSSKPLGVDVEDLQREIDHLGIADRFFTETESAALRNLPDAKQHHRFFQLWTAKEAYMKATGEGLHLSPRKIEVVFHAETPASIRRLDGEVDGPWFLTPVRPAASFLGALVAATPDPPRFRAFVF